MTHLVTLFAHFDAQERVRPYILAHLEALKGVSGEIHFVSTSAVNAASREALRPFCDSVSVIENRGYDFVMWQRALEVRGYGGVDELLLTNSSVLGPLRPLSTIFEEMQGRPADFWGITESVEFRWHIQSYFLYLRAPVVKSGAFADFIRSVLPYSDKDQLIKSYELGLSAWLQDSGFKGAALLENLRNDPRCRLPRANPTVGDPLLTLEFGSPYVKTSLFRYNPYHVNLEALRTRIVALGYAPELLPELTATSVPWHTRIEARVAWQRLRAALGVPIVR